MRMHELINMILSEIFRMQIRASHVNLKLLTGLIFNFFFFLLLLDFLFLLWQREQN